MVTESLSSEARGVREAVVRSLAQSKTKKGRERKKYMSLIGRGVSGGYRALFRFDLSACYHPNLGIFCGVWLFQKKNLPKKDPMPVKSLFENTMGNPFFPFFNIDQNSSKKI